MNVRDADGGLVKRNRCRESRRTIYYLDGSGPIRTWREQAPMTVSRTKANWAERSSRFAGTLVGDVNFDGRFGRRRSGLYSKQAQYEDGVTRKRHLGCRGLVQATGFTNADLVSRCCAPAQLPSLASGCGQRVSPVHTIVPRNQRRPRRAIRATDGRRFAVPDGGSKQGGSLIAWSLAASGHFTDCPGETAAPAGRGFCCRVNVCHRVVATTSVRPLPRPSIQI